MSCMCMYVCYRTYINTYSNTIIGASNVDRNSLWEIKYYVIESHSQSIAISESIAFSARLLWAWSQQLRELWPNWEEMLPNYQTAYSSFSHCLCAGVKVIK